MTSMEASRGTQNTNVEAEFDREDVREWGTMNSIFTGRDVQLLSTPELNMVLGAATRHREISNELLSKTKMWAARCPGSNLTAEDISQLKQRFDAAELELEFDEGPPEPHARMDAATRSAVATARAAWEARRSEMAALSAHEEAALISLAPSSVAEALSLLPTLRRFKEPGVEDLLKAIEEFMN